uniref:Macrocin O-methyltransferase n=1 Tax=Haptolina brevifila TaxID=156173 RepID=A0A6U7EL59_9EUKA|mmetsp:Transcript_34833/g.69454  ORF Transcript_34833/g.69454 Transcript_34833/m.69454 type:complete len:301 (+) Transcript_34833:12-914(+)
MNAFLVAALAWPFTFSSQTTSPPFDVKEAVQTPDFERRVANAPLSTTILARPLGDVRASFFQRIVSYLHDAHIHGDYVETGVQRGFSAVASGGALACRNMLRPKGHARMWLYDSWEGFPASTVEDGEYGPTVTDRLTNRASFKRADPGRTFEMFAGKGYSPEAVRQKLQNAGVATEDAVVFRKGWFNDTFKQVRPKRVAFLHIDSDIYQSVYDTLVAFYDLVEPGGVVLFDDFGHFEGARRAFYKFLVWERREMPLLERHGYTEAFFIKGKQHNRPPQGSQASNPFSVDNWSSKQKCQEV